jgi:Leucine-rich repeat (LRR) protein
MKLLLFLIFVFLGIKTQAQNFQTLFSLHNYTIKEAIKANSDSVFRLSVTDFSDSVLLFKNLLYLSVDKGNSINDNIVHCKKIIGLEIKNCTQISAISQIRTLKYLSIYKSSINDTNFWNEVTMVTTLECIGIDSCSINTIPLEINKLSNLSFLVLRNLHLTKISSDIHISLLKEIYINNCNLKEIPIFLYNSVLLEKINLTDNKVRYVSNKIGNLQSLVDLNFTNNRIETLPYNIGKLKKIKTLIMCNNPLLKIATNTAFNIKKNCKEIIIIVDRVEGVQKAEKILGKKINYLNNADDYE